MLPHAEATTNEFSLSLLDAFAATKFAASPADDQESPAEIFGRIAATVESMRL